MRPAARPEKEVPCRWLAAAGRLACPPFAFVAPAPPPAQRPRVAFLARRHPTPGAARGADVLTSSLIWINHHIDISVFVLSAGISIRHDGSTGLHHLVNCMFIVVVWYAMASYWQLLLVTTL